MGRTTIYVATDNIIRITHAPTDKPTARDSLIATHDWPTVPVKKTEDANTVSIKTKSMTISVDKASGKVSMLNGAGNPLLDETNTSFSPAKDLPATGTSYQMSQSWGASDGESLYGGGEYQNGLLDYAGTTLQMIQFNTEAVVPFFVSSKGYGLLWDNYAAGYLNPPSSTEQLHFEGTRSVGVDDGTPAELSSCHEDPRQGATRATIIPF